MADVLFIKANDRSADQSVTVKMYETFLKTYKEANPNDQITELDLFKEELPYYGNTAIMGLFKQGQGLAQTPEEKKMAELVGRYLDQFLAADKVVMAFPMWNFTVPAPMITYISYLAQAGKTFKYTAEGPVGLVGDKKIALLSARGGIYSVAPASSAEMAMNYVKNILNWWGIQNPVEIIIEGHNQFPEKSAQIIADGLEATTKAAAQF
ncbi:FMN-dependent NADH-azoreductase [Weizmannia acidilactici]|nr:FMN-dependent NADH-azoreductase [Weizmannia acidilactici]GER67001.1 FMN-dependent NADH-azoreductase 1 [Weizmannia acidilactici]GER73282.1 FMN-dependent NADH-azoreductase 1 [Weizmannia acidilactici]